MAGRSAPAGALARLSFEPNLVVPSLLGLLDPDALYPIFWSLCHHLDIQSIIRLTRTCKRLSGLYKYLEPRLWDVDARLSRWFANPRNFRELLTQQNALVSGSFLIQYFDRVTFSDADFDIFVLGRDSFENVKKYLQAVESYRFVPDSVSDSEYFPDGVVRIETFYKGERKLQIVGTDREALRTILTNFYSTHVVNVMNGHKAYSLFPYTTFIQRKGYMLASLEEWHKKAIQKYVRRGWRIEELLWEHEHGPKHPIRQHRRVHDKYTWSITFDKNISAKASKALQSLELSTFEIGKHEVHQPAPSDGDLNLHYYVNIERSPFVSPILKHEYLWYSRELMSFLGERCTALTRTELRKLADADRPADYDAWVARTDAHFATPFPKPDYWTHYDDQFAIWLKQWEVQMGFDN